MPGLKVSVPVLMLTRMGRELISLLRIGCEKQNLRELVKEIDKTGLASISLAEIIHRVNETYSFNMAAIEAVWNAPGNADPS